MKKVLAVVLTVCVVFAAGSALANQQRKVQTMPQQQKVFEGPEHMNQQRMNHPEAQKLHAPEMRSDFRPCNFEGREPNNRGFEGRRPMFAPDMPKEIREKVAELAKLRIDLEEALTDKPINKTKALEVHKKMQKLEQDLDDWKFEKKLERIEAMRKQYELQRKQKPVPPAPKPESKPQPEQVKE